MKTGTVGTIGYGFYGRTRSRATLAFMIHGALLACGGSDGQLTDRAASAAINHSLRGFGAMCVPTGDLIVVADSRSTNEGEIRRGELDGIGAWAEAELVAVGSDERGSFDAATSDWAIWSSRLAGVGTMLVVSPTARGLDFSKNNLIDEDVPVAIRVRFGSRSLCARVQSSVVESIVENKRLERASHLFQLIKGTIESEWTDEGARVFQAAGWPMPQLRKFVALLEYDPFVAEWNVVTWQLADLDAHLSTSNIDEYLTKFP